jgi:hypothetical protein
MNYFIAPRSGEKSYKNFVSTIKHGVPLIQIENFLTDQGKEVLKKQETIYAWANRAGKKAEWNRMQTNDTVIFYAKGFLVMAGTVIYKQHSKELALAMWPADEHGNPWEYTFFVNNLRYFKIPLPYFNLISGYKFKAIMGFIQISEEKKLKILKNVGSFEKLFIQFQDEYSVEIPKQDEKIYVNIEPEISPEISIVKTEANILNRNNSKTKRKGFIDFDVVHINNARTGSVGEEIVLEQEKKYLISCGRTDLVNNVKRVSLEDTYAGYDILSFDKNGNQKKIEVKSTTGPLSKSFSFNVSYNEMKTAKNCDNYFIYLVFNVHTKSPKIRIIEYPFISDTELHVEPKSFVAYGKFKN